MINTAGATSNVRYIMSGAADAAAGLTPESLLLYCSRRLQSLDANIQQYFKQQEDQNKAIADAGKLIDILQQGNWCNGQKGGNEFNVNDPQIHADEANQLLDLFRKTGSPEVRDACAKAFHEVSGRDIGAYAGNTSTISAADIQQSAGQISRIEKPARDAEIEAVKSTQASMTKSGEMNMMQLQSLVQSRQLAVQMTTQLLQISYETLKAPIANLRV